MLSLRQVMVLLTLALLGGLLSTSTFAQGVQEETLWKTAYKYFDNAGYTEAVPLFQQFIAIYPESTLRDKAYLKLAIAFQKLGKADDVVTTVRALDQQYPKSTSLPDAYCAQYLVQLAQNLPAATQTLETLFTRWPESFPLWQAIDARYTAEARTDPAAALAHLDALAQRPGFPKDEMQHVQLYHLQYTKQKEPEKYLDGIVAFFQANKTAANFELLYTILSLAGESYEPLMQAGRYDDALSIFQTMRTIYVAANPPQNVWRDGVVLNYFTALAKTNPERFKKEAVPFANKAKTAQNLNEVFEPAYLIRYFYTYYADQGNLDEGKRWHELAQAQFTRLGLQEMGLYDHLTYWRIRFAAIQWTPQYPDEVKALLDETKVMRSTDEVTLLSEHTGKAYDRLLDAGRLDDAKRLYQRYSAIFPEDDSLSRGGSRQLRTYLGTLYNGVRPLLTLRQVTPEMSAKLRDRFKKAWLAYPNEAIDTALLFIRGEVLDAGTPLGFEWFTIYSMMVPKVPAFNPNRLEAYALLARAGRTLSLRADAEEMDGSGMAAAAEQADQTIIKEFPTSPKALPAYRDLLLGYERDGRTADIEKLMVMATGDNADLPTLAWAADYYAHCGTAEGFTRAQALYTRLLTLAPGDERGAEWQYRIARCLDGLGKRDEALAAYTTLVTKYAKSAVAALATMRLDQLKGGK